METIEPSVVSPLLGTVVHRPSDFLVAPVPLDDKRAGVRRWMRSVAPFALVPSPLVAFNAWAVLRELWVTQRKLTQIVRHRPLPRAR